MTGHAKLGPDFRPLRLHPSDAPSGDSNRGAPQVMATASDDSNAAWSALANAGDLAGLAWRRGSLPKSPKGREVPFSPCVLKRVLFPFFGEGSVFLCLVY